MRQLSLPYLQESQKLDKIGLKDFLKCPVEPQNSLQSESGLKKKKK